MFAVPSPPVVAVPVVSCGFLEFFIVVSMIFIGVHIFVAPPPVMVPCGVPNFFIVVSNVFADVHICFRPTLFRHSRNTGEGK